MRRPASRSYVVWLLGSVGAVLALAALLNTAVNPLRVTPTPWSIDRLDPHRVVEHYERTAKSGYVRSADWDVAFFGSSRVDLGLDPDHPAFAGRRAVNLALSAGKLTENVEMLRYAVEREKLDLVVFGVDLTDLAVPVRAPKTDFHASPLAREGNPLDRELQYLFGLNMLKGSLTTLARALADQPSEHLPNGHWVWQRPVNRQRHDAQRKALPQAFGLSRNRQAVRLQSANASLIDPGKAALFTRALSLARQEGARLVVILPPNHAVLNAGFYLLDDPDPNFTTERRFLAETVAADNAAHPGAPAFEVWDFDDFHPLNCEPLPEDGGPAMRDWLDATHPGPSLGARMIDAFSTPAAAAARPDYGRLLSPATLAETLRARDAGYARFRAEQPETIAWIESVLSDLRANASALNLRPEE